MQINKLFVTSSGQTRFTCVAPALLYQLSARPNRWARRKTRKYITHSDTLKSRREITSFSYTHSVTTAKNVKRKKRQSSFPIHSLIKNAESRGNEPRENRGMSKSVVGKAYLPLNAFPRPPITEYSIDDSLEKNHKLQTSLSNRD